VAAPAASWSRTGASAGGAAASEWAAWYTQLLTRATGQSARTLELYQQVLAAIARGDLAPTALQDLLPGFLQARGASYTNALTELTTKFYAGLVEIGAAHSRELVELVVPGSSVPDVTPPRLDSTDPLQWFQRLTEYAGQLNARAMKIYQTHLNRVAAGDTTAEELQRTMSEYLERRLPEHLRQAGQLYFQLLNDLNDIRTKYEEDYLLGVLASFKRPGGDEAFALNLTAPLGGVASASLSVANTTEERAHVRCRATDVRRADGVGPAFTPKTTITPEHVELGPGEEVSLRLSVHLDKADYDTNVLYVGELHVTGHREPRLEVPLRITATEPASSLEPAVSKEAK
jgi:hypothetical protein